MDWCFVQIILNPETTSAVCLLNHIKPWWIHVLARIFINNWTETTTRSSMCLSVCHHVFRYGSFQSSSNSIHFRLQPSKTPSNHIISIYFNHFLDIQHFPSISSPFRSLPQLLRALPAWWPCCRPSAWAVCWAWPVAWWPSARPSWWAPARRQVGTGRPGET